VQERDAPTVTPPRDRVHHRVARRQPRDLAIDIVGEEAHVMQAFAAPLKKPRNRAGWVGGVCRRKNLDAGASTFGPCLWNKGNPDRLPGDLFNV
jgi:hypothetical protein